MYKGILDVIKSCNLIIEIWEIGEGIWVLVNKNGEILLKIKSNL